MSNQQQHHHQQQQQTSIHDQRLARYKQSVCSVRISVCSSETAGQISMCALFREPKVRGYISLISRLLATYDHSLKRIGVSHHTEIPQHQILGRHPELVFLIPIEFGIWISVAAAVLCSPTPRERHHARRATSPLHPELLRGYFSRD